MLLVMCLAKWPKEFAAVAFPKYIRVFKSSKPNGVQKKILQNDTTIMNIIFCLNPFFKKKKEK